MSSTDKFKKTGLALSGGGVRASAFHAGVLLYLAELEELENVKHISSVSGGTLFTGLVFHESGYVWPASAEYRQNVYPKIRKLLTSHCLQTQALKLLLLKPSNWKHLFYRANILAQAVEAVWGVGSSLGDLPDKPFWSINGTTAETGKRFFINGSRLGDYKLGYFTDASFRLSRAMAISAAFPVGIGPLKIKTRQYDWHPPSGHKSGEYKMPYSSINVYDGGVYDNMGTEPLYGIGAQSIKPTSGVNHIIISDAGAPCKEVKLPGPLNPMRVKRLLDITTEQTRSLRVRSFANFLGNNPERGFYCQLGAIPAKIAETYKTGREERVREVLNATWLSEKQIKKAQHYGTNLKKLKERDFDNIARHGYETMRLNRIMFEVREKEGLL